VPVLILWVLPAIVIVGGGVYLTGHLY